MSGKRKTSARLASGLIILNGVSRRLPVVHPKVRHGWGALPSVPEKGFGRCPLEPGADGGLINRGWAGRYLCNNTRNKQANGPSGPPL